ncbi:SET domain-containing protein [Pseudomonadota bacterium]
MDPVRISQKNNPLVFVQKSPIHGRGLFAAQALSNGEMIGFYEGPVVSEDGTYVLWVEDTPGGSWTAYLGTNEMRFMNHDDEPNAELDGLNCYALEDIEAGTEITIDYGWNDS